MKRYVYYHYFIVCFTNLILFIPYHLIQHRYSGAVLAICLSPFIGWLLIYLFTMGLNKFPSKGLPEIFKGYYPKWIVNPLMIFIALVIGCSSAMAISSYAVIISRFLNPEGNSYIILLALMLVCAYGATRSTLSVNFILEMVLILTVPLVVFLMYKTMRNPQLSWDAMHVIANHITQIPSMFIIICSLFFYTGFFNLGIFNRVFPINFRYERTWIFPIIGLVILIVTFFVPIGIHGTETVAEYKFVWSATTDATQMIYGFIERVLFLFLIMLINFSLTFTVIGWHMVVQYIRSILPNDVIDPDEKKTPVSNYIIVAIIVAASFLLFVTNNENRILMLSTVFIVVRMITEVIVTIWLYVLSKKKVKSFDKKIKS